MKAERLKARDELAALKGLTDRFEMRRKKEAKTTLDLNHVDEKGNASRSKHEEAKAIAAGYKPTERASATVERQLVQLAKRGFVDKYGRGNKAQYVRFLKWKKENEDSLKDVKNPEATFLLYDQIRKDNMKKFADAEAEAEADAEIDSDSNSITDADSITETSEEGEQETLETPSKKAKISDYSARARASSFVDALNAERQANKDTGKDKDKGKGKGKSSASASISY